MKQTSFWVEDHPRPEGLTSDLPAQCDVAIVGSGLTGLSAAVRLAQGGRSVVVLDRNEIASGASSINGGMVSPDVKAGVRAVYEKHGPEIGRAMWDASVRSVELIIDHAKRYALEAKIINGGMTGLGIRTGDLKYFETQVGWYREQFGVDWEVVGPDRIGELVGGSDSFNSGFYEPGGIGVQPAGLVFGLAEAAAHAGARLVSNCPATSTTRNGSGFIVATPKGDLKAGQVIVATNGYTTTEPLPALARKMVSIGSYIIVTEPLAEDEAKTIFPTNSMSYTRGRLLNYMRRTPDNRILIGGRRNLHPGLDLKESAQELRGQMIGFWPSLADKEITHVWGGRLGVPFDLVPHMGQEDGVWYAMGYAGHGVGLSALLGHELAGMLLGEDPPSVFTKVPHKGRWYYRNRPWFLTPASMLYRALDRVGR